jgi:quinol monooxygenase YgiN
MFVVLYRWKVKPEHEAEFIEAWSHLTAEILSRQGSLGSRLHRSDDGLFVAYAQWPSREVWERSKEVGFTPKAQEWRRTMQERAVRILPDTHMSMVDDHLIHA